MSAVNAEPPRRPAVPGGSRRSGVHRFLGRLHEVLDGVGTDTLWALSPEELAECLTETYLAGEAHAHDTRALRRLADHLEEVIDPHGADARLAEQLARAEARAARTMFLNLTHDEVTATTTGSFRIPLLDGVRLQRMLESLLNPGRPDPLPVEDPATGMRLSAEE